MRRPPSPFSSQTKARLASRCACFAMALAGASACAQGLELDTDATHVGEFVYSPALMHENRRIGTILNAVAPARLNAARDGVAAAISAVTLTEDNLIAKVASTGGSTQTAKAFILACSGGSLTVSNLTYHRESGQLFGDLSGSNGVASLSQVAIFTITRTLVDGVEVNTSTPIEAGTHIIVNAGLFLASRQVAAYFKKALGLYALGATNFDRLNDPGATPAGFGTLTSTMTFKVIAAAPPTR